MARLFRQTAVFLKKYNRHYFDLGRLIVRVKEHGFIWKKNDEYKIYCNVSLQFRWTFEKNKEKLAIKIKELNTFFILNILPKLLWRMMLENSRINF